MFSSNFKMSWKLSFDFLYLVKNNSNSRQAKQWKSKNSFPLTIFFFFFFFLILSNIRKCWKLYSVLVHLDSRISACGLKSCLDSFKRSRISNDKSTNDFNPLKYLDSKWYLKLMDLKWKHLKYIDLKT